MGSVVKAVASIATKAFTGFSPLGFIGAVALNFAISFAAKKIFGSKPSTSPLASTFTTQARDRQVVVRSAVQSHRVLYGRSMLSGALVFAETTSSNRFLHMVVTLVGHKVAAIERVLFNDVVSTDARFTKQRKQIEKWKLTAGAVSGSNLTGTIRINGKNFTGTVTESQAAETSALVDAIIADITGDAGYASESYTVSKLIEQNFAIGFVFGPPPQGGVIQVTAKSAGTGFTVSDIAGTWTDQVVQSNLNQAFADVRTLEGDIDQAADATLVSDVTAWTSAHRLRGIAYMIAKLRGDQDKWPTGVPNPKALIKGRLVYDPRITGKTITSSSAADPAVFTIASHGFTAGTPVFVRNHADAVPAVFGEYIVTTVVDADNVRLTDLNDPDAEIALSIGGSGGTATAMLWSDNAALCLADYLCAWFGLRAEEDEIDFDDVITAANICDEQVTLSSTTEDFTADNTTNTMTLAGVDVDIRTGDAVELTTTGSLPTGLSTSTDYYFINQHVNDVLEFQLATSLANARAGTAISISNNGSGTHTIEHKSHLRYTANGVLDLARAPATNIQEMVSSMAGTLSYSGGQFRLFAGAYTASVLSLDESSLRGDIDLVPKDTMRDRFNAVRGTFSNPARFYQPTSFPPVENSTYAVEDGEQIFDDIELPFTDQSVAAQRLAKVKLEKSRQGMVIKAPCNLSALKVAVGDVVDWTIDELGFSGKLFRVLNWSLAEDGGVDLVCREESAASYNWAAGEETAIDTAPNTDLPNPFDAPAAITNLALASGTSYLLDTGDGNVLSRIYVTWDAVTDELVLNGGRLILGYKKSSETSWNEITLDDTSVSAYYITGVQDGIEYDVRIKARNNFFVAADEYTFVLNHLVAGKSEPPSDVEGFSASWDGSVVIFKWNQVPDSDLAGYEIRFENQGITYAHNNATPVTEVTKGTTITTIAVMPGAWQFGIVAVDASGNKSTTPATYSLTVGNSYNLLAQRNENPKWLGTLTGLVEHWTGKLMVQSQDIADDQGWETFDTYVSNPVATASYEAPELDIDFDDIARLYGAIQYQPGPGVAGTPVVNLQVDEKLDAGAYTGFENWTVGVKTGRYFKHKLVVDTTKPLPVITAFKPTVDKQTVTESKQVSVAGAGSAIVFDNEFHNTPTLDVSAEGAAAVIATYENLDTQGFDAHLFNTAGTGVSGNMTYTARGA